MPSASLRTASLRRSLRGRGPLRPQAVPWLRVRGVGSRRDTCPGVHPPSSGIQPLPTHRRSCASLAHRNAPLSGPIRITDRPHVVDSEKPSKSWGGGDGHLRCHRNVIVSCFSLLIPFTFSRLFADSLLHRNNGGLHLSFSKDQFIYLFLL